jgi:hypothetical protein
MDTAQLNAMHRILKTRKAKDVSCIEISLDDLRLALSTVRPCLNPDAAAMLGEIYQQYGFHPDSSGEKVYLGFTS